MKFGNFLSSLIGGGITVASNYRTMEMVGMAVGSIIACVVGYFIYQHVWWFTMIAMVSTLFALSPFGWLEDEILIPLIGLCWFVVVIHWLGAKCGCWSSRFEGFESTKPSEETE